MVWEKHNLMNIYAYFINTEHWNFIAVQIISVSKLMKYSEEEKSTFKDLM